MPVVDDLSGDLGPRDDHNAGDGDALLGQEIIDRGILTRGARTRKGR